MRELTGVSKESLSFFPVRCKPESATEPDGRMKHPFVLISSIVEKVLAVDEGYFEIMMPLAGLE